MSQIYVTDTAASIGMDQNQLKIIYADKTEHNIPIESVDGISVFGNAQISTKCIGECLKRGIALQYYSSKGAYYGKLSSTKHVNTARQKAQVLASNNEQFCLNIGKAIISSKINNQIVLIKRYGRNHIMPDTEIMFMQQSLNNLSRATNIAELIGYEGVAAKAYFKALNTLVSQNDFHFNGRNKRPPKDPFNSMLSLGYSLLLNGIYGAIEARGLNPYFGFIHQDKEKHPSLASDLIEEWRSLIVDSTVMALINRHEIKIEHFYSYNNKEGVYLTKDGLKIFISRIEAKIRASSKYLQGIDYPFTHRKAIDFQILQLCKAVEQNDANIYIPLVLR